MSPYYNKSHVAWRERVRKFVETEVTPNCHDWDNSPDYKLPKDLYVKFAKAGLLPGVVGAPWPAEFTNGSLGPANFDAFHELILIDELARCGSGGVLWGLFEGIQIGLPPVINFGSKALQQKVVPGVLSGEKIICLCISEPWAGSDVANLRTTAKKTPCGKYFIVSGAKKWITNGMFSDFFTVAVRTGGPGMGGLSLLLLEKGMPGLSCRHMKCSGVWPSGTTYVSLDEVKVPVSNLIGKEGNGFKMIMSNFNHERWGFVVQANRLARVCLEDAFKYAMKRRTFGKRLVDHQLIRWKISEMARQIDATHAWLEQVTYQMATLKKSQRDKMLAGPIALLKAHSTKVLEYVAREAAQIFGGASYVRSGVGERVERIYREVRAYAIPGGSEEIMEDFAARQAIKKAAKALKSSL
jgi:alkylation response protein AidB-like acyl-CoA dehydrogenase